jgi:hypothetical protein
MQHNSSSTCKTRRTFLPALTALHVCLWDCTLPTTLRIKPAAYGGCPGHIPGQHDSATKVQPPDAGGKGFTMIKRGAATAQLHQPCCTKREGLNPQTTTGQAVPAQHVALSTERTRRDNRKEALRPPPLPLPFHTSTAPTRCCRRLELQPPNLPT